MITTSKSPRKVLLVTYHVGSRTLRDYTHRYSPKKFTQAQLFACLVLKEYFRMDYRKLESLLRDTPGLCAEIGLYEVPHFTTFQKAVKRLLNNQSIKRLLGNAVAIGIATKRMKRRIHLAAVDGTGFASRHVSSYFMKRFRAENSAEYTAWKRC